MELTSNLFSCNNERSKVKPLKKSKMHKATMWTCSSGTASYENPAKFEKRPKKNTKILPRMLNFLQILSNIVLTIINKAKKIKAPENENWRDETELRAFSASLKPWSAWPSTNGNKIVTILTSFHATITPAQFIFVTESWQSLLNIISSVFCF